MYDRIYLVDSETDVTVCAWEGPRPWVGDTIAVELCGNRTDWKVANRPGAWRSTAGAPPTLSIYVDFIPPAKPAEAAPVEVVAP